MTAKIVVAALYKFVSLPDYEALREPLLNTMLECGVKGTLLLAEEGINGTVSATREGIDGLLAWLKRDARLADVDHKESYCDEQPFYRTKVKLKKEIVTLGVPGVDPNQRVGTYVEPKDWNALIADPEVLLIDTRNDYEVAIGTFERAIDPKTNKLKLSRKVLLPKPEDMVLEIGPGPQGATQLHPGFQVLHHQAGEAFLLEGVRHPGAEEVALLRRGALARLLLCGTGQLGQALGGHVEQGLIVGAKGHGRSSG
mgnify:CR=1 FL=1